MRILTLIVALLLAVSSRAETLREFLKANAIPENYFSKSELMQEVNGAAGTEDGLVVAVYVRVKGEELTGNPIVVRYDRNSAAIQRAEVKPEDEDMCCGSPDDLMLLHDFAIISFHINPDAETMLVVGKDLKLVTTLYGFDVREIAPGQVVFIENMVHFAAVHPERLNWPICGTAPPKSYIRPRAMGFGPHSPAIMRSHMPSKATCEKMDDPCTPELYDEDNRFHRRGWARLVCIYRASRCAARHCQRTAAGKCCLRGRAVSLRVERKGLALLRREADRGRGESALATARAGRRIRNRGPLYALIAGHRR